LGTQPEGSERESQTVKATARSASRRRFLTEHEDWVSGGQEGSAYRPGVRSFSSLSSSPALCALAVLTAFLTVLSSPPLRERLVNITDIPKETWLSIFHMRAELPASDETVVVWGRPGSGLYYCRDETLFGRQPGRFLSQGEALTLGYRPAGQRYCSGHARQTQAILPRSTKSPVSLWALVRRALS
jgi:hypothetical protein